MTDKDKLEKLHKEVHEAVETIQGINKKSLLDALIEIGDGVTDWGPWPGDCVVLGCELKGGGACPEQYDVYLNGEMIGYLHLRHGAYYAAYGPVMKPKTVYRASPKGDGIFDDDEREGYLYMGVLALLSEHRDAQGNKND